uniref:Uncharacterized protein n=1 Tax=viral metagenome TaxID=1070528 RepID=A0A6C0J4P8_9ZZZZ
MTTKTTSKWITGIHLNIGEQVEWSNKEYSYSSHRNVKRKSTGIVVSFIADTVIIVLTSRGYSNKFISYPINELFKFKESRSMSVVMTIKHISVSYEDTTVKIYVSQDERGISVLVGYDLFVDLMDYETIDGAIFGMLLDTEERRINISTSPKPYIKLIERQDFGQSWKPLLDSIDIQQRGRGLRECKANGLTIVLPSDLESMLLKFNYHQRFHFRRDDICFLHEIKIHEIPTWGCMEMYDAININITDIKANISSESSCFMRYGMIVCPDSE